MEVLILFFWLFAYIFLTILTSWLSFFVAKIYLKELSKQNTINQA